MRYSIGKRWWLIAVLGGALLGPARGAEPGSLAEEIRRLAGDARLSKMRVGIRIESLGTTRSVVYEQNADELLKPASNQKLITTAAAMSLLPADFTYRTILALRGEDLVIIGAGDPSIGDLRMAQAKGEPITAIFHQWAERLKADGVTTIRGDLLFDDSIFEQEHLHPHWKEQFKNSLESWWAAPVGGLNFNANCIDVAILPGAKAGAPAEVTLIPNTPYVLLENSARTAEKGEPLVKRTGPGPHRIVVSGVVSKPRSAEDPMSIAIADPGAFFASICRTVLAARGIRIEGQCRRQRFRQADGSLPGDLKIVAVYERKLSEALWRVNKSSINMFAEAVLKTMASYAGREKEDRIGSTETGRALVREFLTRLGVRPEHYVFDDGSGLSHDNRVTAALFTAVLAHMDRHPRRDEFRASLAVPGEKGGTLVKRMKELKGQVFAKTGHIGGVSTLGGYVLGPSDRRYVFSILCNDTDKGEAGSAHRMQDEICRKLATWGAASTRPGG